MILQLDDWFVTVLVLGFLGLFVFALLVRKTSWGYVGPRFKQFISGGRFIHAVDLDNNSVFECVKEKNGSLQCKDRLHTIEKGSGLKNIDGTIYYVHKDLVPALTAQFIISDNILTKLGFKSFAHAFDFYKLEYFKEDIAALSKETDGAKRLNLERDLEKKAGLNLMAPVQEDYFTQNLAIVNNFNNQRLSAYGMKNVADSIRNEAERQNSKGLAGSQLFTYVTAIIALLCGLAFALKIAGKI